MATMWMPGAKAMAAPKDGGSMTGGEALVTWHYYVAPYSMRSVDAAAGLNRNGTSVHLTFHPITGEWIQMIPANRAGRGLKNAAGGVETNRRGRVNIQIEVIANSPDWWKDLTPAGRAGLARGMEWFRALGVPDQWVADPASQTGTPNGRSGHTSHRSWVENDHTDYLSAAPWDLVKGTAAPAAPAVAPPKPSTPAPVRPNLTVDGALGPATYRALQKVIGVTADGVWGTESKKGLQRWLGVTADGAVGPQTIKALQARIGATADGVWGPATTKALQAFLNRG